MQSFTFSYLAIIPVTYSWLFFSFRQRYFCSRLTSFSHDQFTELASGEDEKFERFLSTNNSSLVRYASKTMVQIILTVHRAIV
jgi:hypothetical protein